jgi:phytoene dehydrogenase-like protein
MIRIKPRYDVVIIGAGHNGLVAASYLGRAGLSVLMLECLPTVGGAAKSSRPFHGVDAKLSVYSYLVSLFPQKIVDDLNLNLQLRSRRIASYTPTFQDGRFHELLVSNDCSKSTQASFQKLPNGEEDYRGYLKLQSMQLAIAKKLWPTLLQPLKTKADLMANLSQEELEAWDALIETPLGEAIEDHISNDLVRGMLFTDAKIGVFTHPHDPSLLQNLTYLYHIIGRGTGEWKVPLGGMGTLTASLKQAALDSKVTIVTGAKVTSVNVDNQDASLTFEKDEIHHDVDCRFVLNNAAPKILNSLIGHSPKSTRAIDEGSVIKINLLLKKLPALQSKDTSSQDAFSGTFHIDEGYEQMTDNYHNAAAGQLAERPAGEMYCHSLTDNSILSDQLNQEGYHTLTLFGLDMPYSLFEKNNEQLRSEALERFLAGINQYTKEPIQECIAEDSNGAPCIEIKTPVDLENEIHLPRGNIFHNALTWPFAEESDEAGSWGVETDLPNVFTCGSGARRGGAVSGIPGHNAAMKVLEITR